MSNSGRACVPMRSRLAIRARPSAPQPTLRAVGTLDPRLAARWDATGWLAWVVALGVAHQASNIPLPSPGLEFSQLSRGLQSAFQYSAGAELKLPSEFSATGNVFVHEYTGIADYLESCPSNEPSCTFRGRAVGLEVMVRRSLTKRLSGWISYTLSRTDRDAFYNGGWIRRLSEFDRPHVGNAPCSPPTWESDAGGRRALRLVSSTSGLPYSTTITSAGRA